MNFYIKKNSTLPKLSVEIIIDNEVSFRNTYESFSASTITFNMKEKETGFYKIIGKSVTVKEKETVNDSPLKSFYLETQFTKKETSKLGTFLGEFKISNDKGITILPISNEFVINIIDSFSNSDFCCRPNRGYDPYIFPSETPKPSLVVTPTPSTSLTPSITPSITPTISVTPSITPSITPTISITPSITPTISITPSITPTISVTPSITPTISVTPSITPTISITPSVTPTIYMNPTPPQGDNTIYVYYPNL